MRLWDLIFLMLLFFIYWIVLGDKLHEAEMHRAQQHHQEVSNVIRPSTK
jgi:hypothetical protein